MHSSDNRVVWTSDGGRVGGSSSGTPKTSRKRKAKAGRAGAESGFPQDGVTRVRREKGGRGGKTVTVLHGFPGADEARLALLKELKKVCGCGGACKDGRIEIQGDQREKILGILAAKGISAKAAGG